MFEITAGGREIDYQIFIAEIRQNKLFNSQILN